MILIYRLVILFIEIFFLASIVVNIKKLLDLLQGKYPEILKRFGVSNTWQYLYGMNSVASFFNRMNIIYVFRMIFSTETANIKDLSVQQRIKNVKNLVIGAIVFLFVGGVISAFLG